MLQTWIKFHIPNECLPCHPLPGEVRALCHLPWSGKETWPLVGKHLVSLSQERGGHPQALLLTLGTLDPSLRRGGAAAILTRGDWKERWHLVFTGPACWFWLLGKGTGLAFLSLFSSLGQGQLRQSDSQLSPWAVKEAGEISGAFSESTEQAHSCIPWFPQALTRDEYFSNPAADWDLTRLPFAPFEASAWQDN